MSFRLELLGLYWGLNGVWGFYYNLAGSQYPAYCPAVLDVPVRSLSLLVAMKAPQQGCLQW